jgi:sulfur carrier protein
MSDSAHITITINGERREAPQGLTLRKILDHFGIDPQRVAVEFNREIVRRNKWDELAVEEGANLEIVEFVGGGKSPFPLGR